MKFAPALLLLFSVVQAAAAEPLPVLLDFHSESCGPCRQMRPAVKALADKGYPIRSIDVEASPRMAAKYDVQAVPTFIVVDENGGELDRTAGAQPAAQLARFYNDARAKAPQPTRDPQGDFEDDAQDEDAEEEAPAEEVDPRSLTEEELAQRLKEHRKTINPRPWETVVRIKVYNGGSVGFGSGTVVYSTPEESLILTCAHIFKIDDSSKAIPPARFPNKITIDLFDGKLKGRDAQLTCIEEGIPGKAVDYDFATDVGLIRIRPGRKLSYSRIVPVHWQPRETMGMFTVGCSEGHDATAWRTMITKEPTRMLRGNEKHLAIECTRAPKQGRSGGGLYTEDGYVAGVCNFAEPVGKKGLYAAPDSIYKILDRNKLAALYAPASLGSPETLLAAAGAGRPGTIARGQSPEREDRPRTARRGELTMPGPEILGAGLSPLDSSDRRRGQIQPASNRSSNRPMAWAPVGSTEPMFADREVENEDVAVPVHLDLDRSADGTHFPPLDYEDDSRVNDEDLSPRNQSRKPTPSRASSGAGWRPAQTAGR